jgi:hypothetical protein
MLLEHAFIENASQWFKMMPRRKKAHCLPVVDFGNKARMSDLTTAVGYHTYT